MVMKARRPAGATMKAVSADGRVKDQELSPRALCLRVTWGRGRSSQGA